ncbi:hypothetical protein ES332_A08G051200v1 [Gossypium tomentosum]|uniref:Uncharacterized protein n=1 Tax=Gossypium tomentosum TaxID=34277 RepID=A0A5D2PB15_GOSTO|nr:hypothetical protein ES332_A08G051200v1 [Gossypium tomentosum]
MWQETRVLCFLHTNQTKANLHHCRFLGWHKLNIDDSSVGTRTRIELRVHYEAMRDKDRAKSLFRELSVSNWGNSNKPQ